MATINITNSPVTKISSVSGHDTSSVIFQCDEAFDEWEARATTASETPAQGTGLLVGSGTDGYAADTDVSFDVESSELTGGDGVYRISIYAKISGTWY